MKINWATGIVIAFVLFMSFILYFVFLVQSDKKYDNQLVLDNYYKHEMNLENQQQKERNANNLTTKLSITESEKGVEIIFPVEFDFKKIEGKIFLYRPSDQKLDFEIPISLSSSNFLIPISVLTDGRWDISVDWKYQNMSYLNKKSISL